MKWYSLALCIAGIAFESTLLVRAWVWQGFKAYPLFFSYVVCVLAQDIFFFAIFLFQLRYYAPLYWYGEFLSVAFGCAVSWEIFRLVLGPYPGASQMARRLLLVAVGALVVKAVANVSLGIYSWPATAIELERNLRVLQALGLIVLALLSAYYKVPMGRNVKGIFTGYGMFVAMSIITLTLRTSLGASFQTGWTLFQPLCYFAVLVIWCLSLWKYEPVRSPQVGMKMERDYQSLVFATRKSLLQARAVLDRSTRR